MLRNLFKLLIVAVLLSSCKVLPVPRYNEGAYYHKRLEKDGYIEVTVYNLQTGESSIRIVKY